MDTLTNDLSGLNDSEAAQVCALLRARLIDTVSRTGGHLASSLGAVELIVAIHRVFDTGRDRLVFDVGHQCYAHKILTGRNDAMETLRTFGGIAGFPKPAESVCDAFVAGPCLQLRIRGGWNGKGKDLTEAGLSCFGVDWGRSAVRRPGLRGIV